jgi:predicted component of type VI protein secretion system
MRAQLIPLDGGNPIDILRDLTVVGRKEDCDLRLDHKSVSKLHCVLVKTDGLLLLRDLGSTNGTRVNGQRVRRAALLPDDQLTIAGFKYRVQLGGDKAPIAAEEHTQQMDARDVAHLIKKLSPANGNPPERAPSVEPLLPNHLPDVYPGNS